MTIGMIWHGGLPTGKQSEIEFDRVHAKRPCIENQLFRSEAFRGDFGLLLEPQREPLVQPMRR